MNDDELRNLFNGDMDDDEFRRLFTRIMNQRQREMDRFLREIYGLNNPNNPFNSMGFNTPSSRDNTSGMTESNDKDKLYDMFTQMFGNYLGDMGMNNTTNEDGWETKNWMSPDGSMSFSSSSRVFRMDPDEANRVFGDGEREETLESLKTKMALAVEEERYEDANEYLKKIQEKEEKNSDNSEN